MPSCQFLFSGGLAFLTISLYLLPFFFLPILYVFRFLAKEAIGSPYAVWGASMVWGFSPFVLAELQMGRPTQALLGFAALSLACFLRLHRSPRLL